jgi:hypothetical protein
VVSHRRAPETLADALDTALGDGHQEDAQEQLL